MEIKQRAFSYSGRIRGVFTFALLCVYAILACLLLLAGLQVYRSVRNRADENYNGRTAIAYVSAKLRSGADISSADGRVLILSENIADKQYNTYIYCKDGQLLEYFGSATRAFDPTLGEPIASIQEFQVSLQDGLVQCSLQDSGGEAYTASFRQRADREVQP
ncbi:MAG: DUF4860 domain-containing protein [Eubacteriales bacterium]|nr:DUF4860 domain-containing protein [Eubacteriales bacterium]